MSSIDQINRIRDKVLAGENPTDVFRYEREVGGLPSNVEVAELFLESFPLVQDWVRGVIWRWDFHSTGQRASSELVDNELRNELVRSGYL